MSDLLAPAPSQLRSHTVGIRYQRYSKVNGIRTPLVADGVNVIDADKIRLDRASSLYFEAQGDATWAVIRAKSLKTTLFADIESDVPVIILLDGKGPTVSIGRFSDLFSVGILAPARSVKIQGEGYVEGIWAKQAVLTGVDLLSQGLFEP